MTCVPSLPKFSNLPVDVGINGAIGCGIVIWTHASPSLVPIFIIQTLAHRILYHLTNALWRLSSVPNQKIHEVKKPSVQSPLRVHQILSGLITSIWMRIRNSIWGNNSLTSHKIYVMTGLLVNLPFCVFLREAQLMKRQLNFLLEIGFIGQLIGRLTYIQQQDLLPFEEVKNASLEKP